MASGLAVWTSSWLFVVTTIGIVIVEMIWGAELVRHSGFIFISLDVGGYCHSIYICFGSFSMCGSVHSFFGLNFFEIFVFFFEKLRGGVSLCGEFLEVFFLLFLVFGGEWCHILDIFHVFHKKLLPVWYSLRIPRLHLNIYVFFWIKILKF